MLQVGETSNLRPLIEDELGQIPLAPGPGHDGQIYYAIAIDLRGAEVPDLLDHGAYRYRRIAYSLVSSVGGVLGGWPLLYSMVAVVIAGTAVSAGAVAAMAVRGGRSDWLALAVLLNPGVWLSIRLLTADVLALAFMTAGLLFVVSRPWGATVNYALSALSKDVYLATPGGLAISTSRRRWLQFLIPLGVLVVWMTVLTFTMGEGFTGRGNLSLPFVGMVDASSNWGALDLGEWLYLAFALASVVIGVVYGIARRTWLRWSILAWALLGVVSSNWVWDFGNNAARAFLPIAVLVALSFAQDVEDTASTTASVSSSTA